MARGVARGVVVLPAAAAGVIVVDDAHAVRHSAVAALIRIGPVAQ